jgi:hypothetical protein
MNIVAKLALISVVEKYFDISVKMMCNKTYLGLVDKAAEGIMRKVGADQTTIDLLTEVRHDGHEIAIGHWFSLRDGLVQAIQNDASLEDVTNLLISYFKSTTQLTEETFSSGRQAAMMEKMRKAFAGAQFDEFTIRKNPNGVIDLVKN